MAQDPTPTTSQNPTTVRFSEEQLLKLEEISADSGMSRNSLIGLAVDGLVDFVDRHSKLPLRRKKRKSQ